MKLGGKLLVTFAGALILLLIPFLTQASELTVRISEVNWAGSSINSSDEWVILTNLTNESIDLAGFVLEKAATSGKDLVIEEGIIEPNGTFTISNYDLDKSIQTNQPNYVTASLSLSNSKLGITLRDESGGYLDGAGSGGAPFAGRTCGSGEECLPMLRSDLALDGTLKEAWTDASQLDVIPPVVDEAEKSQEPKESEPEPEPEQPKVIKQQVVMNYPPGTLVINEIVSTPETDSKEYVEIYNPYNNVIDLRGWSIRDASGKETGLPGQLLGWSQYIIIEKPNGGLNNKGDIVMLLTPTKDIIDLVEYGTREFPAPKKGESLSRTDEGFVITNVITPKMVNVVLEEEETIPEPIPEPEPESKPITTAIEEPAEPKPRSPQTLKLSELYANTEGNDAEEEFIEVKNVGTETIDAKGLMLEDCSGKIFTLGESHELEPGQFLTLTRSQTNLTLNNDEDTVKLFDHSGTLIDLKAYDSPPTSQSLARIENDWNYTTTITQGGPNHITQPVVEEQQSTTITTGHTVRAARVNKTQYISGTVLVEPGILGKQILYVHDGTHGIQIYKHDAQFPELSVGDEVILTGEPSTSRGENRLKITKRHTIKPTGNTDEVIASERSQLHESDIGSLITISGTILSRSGLTVLLEANEQEQTIKLASAAKISTDQFTRGANTTITGIVRTNSGKLFLSPRSNQDIRIKEDAPTTVVAGTTGKEQATAHHNDLAGLLAVASLIFLTVLAARHFTPKLIELYGTHRSLRLRAQKAR